MRRTALRDKPTLQASASCNLSAERTSVLHCDGDSNKASGRIWVRAPPFILGLQRVPKIMQASRESQVVCELSAPNSGIHSLDSRYYFKMLS